MTGNATRDTLAEAKCILGFILLYSHTINSAIEIGLLYFSTAFLISKKTSLNLMQAIEKGKLFLE
jgi:predicted adenine nucleotide alpha hydrolase (AANH) superfamily ATPase